MQINLKTNQLQSACHFFEEYPPAECLKQVKAIKGLMLHQEPHIIKELTELFQNEISTLEASGLLIRVGGQTINISAISEMIEINGGVGSFKTEIEEITQTMIQYLVGERVGSFKRAYAFLDKFYGVIIDLIDERD